MYIKKRYTKNKNKNSLVHKLIKEVFIKPHSSRLKEIFSKNNKNLQKIYYFIKPALVALSIAPFAANIYLPLSIGSVNSVSGQSYIELSTEGKSEFFYTDKDTISDSLKDKGIDFDLRDKITPSLESKVETGINRVSIVKARPVIIHDDNELIVSKSPYVYSKEILEDLNIKIYQGDIVKVANPLNDLVVVAEIFIDRAPVVNLQVDGQVKEIHTRSENVEQLLLEQNIKLNEKDRTTPSLESALSDGINVSIIRVSQTENTETVDIPFDTEYKNDPNMTQGQTKVEREGAVGKKQVNFQAVVENNVVVSKNIISEQIIVSPINRIVIKGTKPKITLATGAYANIINAAAQKYGIDAQRLSRLMYCESKGNTYAVGGGGKYFGLFQYSASTWAGASVGAGFSGASIYDATAQIYTTAWKISIQGYRAWPTCGY